jgi:hypothetical protein
MGVFSGPLSKASYSTTDIIWWYRPFLYIGLCPFTFLGSWALVTLYLCFSFLFPIDYFWRVCFSSWKGPTPFLIMLTCSAEWFSSYNKGDAPFFWESSSYRRPKSMASFMDIHHDTFYKSILEADSISSTSTGRICSSLGKRKGLWLVVRPFIYLFHITPFIFTSMLRFCFNLI